MQELEKRVSTLERCAAISDAKEKNYDSLITRLTDSNESICKMTTEINTMIKLHEQSLTQIKSNHDSAVTKHSDLEKDFNTMRVDAEKRELQVYKETKLENDETEVAIDNRVRKLEHGYMKLVGIVIAASTIIGIIVQAVPIILKSTGKA